MEPIGWSLMGIGGVVCAAATTPILLGFSTAGIVGGSIAAGLQSSIGLVVGGSYFSVIQSLGATGAFALYSAIGGGVGVLGGAILAF